MLRRPEHERLEPARVDRARAALQRALGDSKVIAEPELLEGYAGDASEQAPSLPDVVVRAESADDVAAALRVASEHGLPVTPRGAATGKSGGAVPVFGGMALCMLGLRAVQGIEREDRIAVAQPGVILGDLHAAVEAEGLFYPPDPNSWASCTLGGNIAENAAGPRAFKYGPTRDYVLGLEVITADGRRLALGRRTRKGVTGYDLTSLVVGSEGTLAVVVSATLKLAVRPERVVTLLASFDDVDDSARAVAGATAAGLAPRCLELVDGSCLAAMRDAGAALPLEAEAVLLVDVDGDAMGVERDVARVGEALLAAGASEVLVAQNEAQRERLWAVRRQLSLITKALARHKISEDVVVPVSRLPALVRQVRGIGEEQGVRMLSYGHAGDGNLHVNLLWNEPSEAPRVERALERLFRTVVAMGGTLSGEHGIGTSKARFLHLEQAPELIGLQRALKATFDPAGILNPGKIFPRGHGSC